MRSSIKTSFQPPATQEVEEPPKERQKHNKNITQCLLLPNRNRRRAKKKPPHSAGNPTKVRRRSEFVSRREIKANFVNSTFLGEEHLQEEEERENDN